MFLDLKGGGAKGRAEGGINQAIGKLFSWKNFKKLLFFSPIGPLLSFGAGLLTLIKGGTITEALDKMAEFIPFLGTILEFLGLKSDDQSIGQAIVGVGQAVGNFIKDGLHFIFVKPVKWLIENTRKFIDSMIGYLRKAYESGKDLVYKYTIGLPGRIYRGIVGSSPGPLNDIESSIGKGYSNASIEVQGAVNNSVKRVTESVKDSFEKGAKQSDDFIKSNVGKKLGGGFLGKTFGKLLGYGMSVIDIGDKIVQQIVGYLVSVLQGNPLPVRIVSGLKDNVENADKVTEGWYIDIKNSLSIATKNIELIYLEILKYSTSQSQALVDAQTRSLYGAGALDSSQSQISEFDAKMLTEKIVINLGGDELGDVLRKSFKSIEIGNTTPININLDKNFESLVRIQQTTLNLLTSELGKIVAGIDLINTRPDPDDMGGAPVVAPGAGDNNATGTPNPATLNRARVASRSPN